tara:strand:+ start:5111 stop:5752 length:642 start_codon:yes stop_codon:yes gene_type:complete
MEQSIYTYIGLIASILIAISIMMTNVKAFRIINLIGASTFAIYGYLIDSIPVFALNFFNTCVDIFYLIKMKNQNEYFSINTTFKGDEFFIGEFLSYFKDDIKSFFPDFSLRRIEKPIIILTSRKMNPVSLFIGEMKEKGIVKIHLDYSRPEYRDLKNAQFLFNESQPLIEKHKIHTLETVCSVPKHQNYLLKMGFTEDAKTPFLYRKRVGTKA